MAGPCITNGTCIELTTVGSPAALQANPIISAVDGNTLECLGDGLYAAGNRAMVLNGVAFPAGYDGQIIDYVADGFSEAVWSMRYWATQPTYKWAFVGGAPINSTDTQNGSGTAVAAGNRHVADTTAPIPRTGFYDFRFDFIAEGDNNGQWWPGYRLGGVTDVYFTEQIFEFGTAIGTINYLSFSFQARIGYAGAVPTTIAPFLENQGATTKHWRVMNAWIQPVLI